jgi:acyl-coenzyme A thioesterase PaaI-like protein
MSHNPVLDRWRRFEKTALGRWCFSRLVGWYAPYTGTLKAVVDRLEPGRVEIHLDDRRRVRNHLKSIHAAALMNLAEMSGGLLATVSMPAGARMIVTGAEIEFLKKARGRILSIGTCEIPESSDRAEYTAKISIQDQGGDEVAAASVRFLIGPAPS